MSDFAFFFGGGGAQTKYNTIDLIQIEIEKN